MFEDLPPEEWVVSLYDAPFHQEGGGAGDEGSGERSSGDSGIGTAGSGGGDVYPGRDEIRFGE